jgi:hypothetical protein
MKLLTGLVRILWIHFDWRLISFTHTLRNSLSFPPSFKELCTYTHMHAAQTTVFKNVCNPKFKKHIKFWTYGRFTVLGRGEKVKRTGSETSCPCLCYEGVWGSRGIAPLTFNISTKCRWVANFMLQLLYFWEGTLALLNGVRCGPQSCCGHFAEEKNMLPVPGLEPWILHPVAQSLYQLNYPGSC